jgi:hypothetical protein
MNQIFNDSPFKHFVCRFFPRKTSNLFVLVTMPMSYPLMSWFIVHLFIHIHTINFVKHLMLLTISPVFSLFLHIYQPISTIFILHSFPDNFINVFIVCVISHVQYYWERKFKKKASNRYKVWDKKRSGRRK